MNTLYNHFEVLEDIRDIRGKKHELIHIIIMTIYGVLCGYTDFVNMTDFLELNEDYFMDWIKEIIGQKGLHVAIDGKAIKSARDKVNKGNVPYILSGFLCDIGLSIC